MNEALYERIKRRSKPGPSGCWEWTGGKAKGYGTISVGGHNRLAHRTIWEAAHGNIPTGLWVLHKCDNPACINPDHLFLGTAKDNAIDCIRKGRGLGGGLGERHARAKLKVKDVHMIRSGSGSCAELARRLGVHTKTIWQVIHGVTWKGV